MARAKKGLSLIVADRAAQPIRYTSQRCFTIARLTWEWAIASLPFDLVFLLSRPVATFYGDDSNSALAVLLCIATAGVFRESLFSAIVSLRRMREKLTQTQMLMALFAVGILGAAEVITRLAESQRRAPFALVFIVVGFILWKSWRAAEKFKKQGAKFLSDRRAQVEQTNILHLIVIVIPVAAARAISFLFAFNAPDGSLFALGMITSLALLFALRPHESDFMAPCPQCQRMTSRALIFDRCCPSCSPEKFQDEAEDLHIKIK